MTIGVLTLARLKELIHLNTGFFETSRYTEDEQMAVTSGNHDDAGMSGGNLQYNFGAADRLQELFLYMLNNYDSVVQTAFGANTTQYNEFRTVITTYTRAQRITWGDGITDWVIDDEGRTLFEPWKTCFANLLITPECKAKYYSMRDAYYWDSPFDIFKQMSCTSRLSLASFFDVYVNKGRFYPINLLQYDFDNIDADTTIDAAEKERQKIYQINVRANEEENALNDTSSSYFEQRRNCMRDQGGTYYNALYDPDIQFDMNQEPAITEKAATLGIKLGETTVDNVYLGLTAISKVYLGANLLSGVADPYTIAAAPQTQFRTNPNYYEGLGAATSIELLAGQPLWVDVQNFVACRTYFTVDGSTPTTASPLYTEALSFNTSCTLKTLTVSIFGVAEAVKTLTVTIVVAPTTTISPSATIQNTIPFTVTLTTDEAGATIYYKLGTGAQQTYTAPFQVNQSSAGVASTQIKVTYWAVGADATELEKILTYDTSGAVAGKPAVTVTNGVNQVKLDWLATANTTSYTIYRSTTAGTLGSILSGTQYMTALTWTDTTAAAGTTYYYTVKAANYGAYSTNSDQVTGIPTAPATGWRYLKIDGYGENGNDTTRMIEVEAWVGSTNVLAGKTAISYDVTMDSGSTDIKTVTNGTKTTTAGTYPIWWSVTPNGNVVFDLGSQQALTKLNYYAFSTATDQRASQFIIYASNTNNGTDWTPLWNMSTNTALQPVLPSGYELIL